ncbi:hypothetical protein D3C85_1097050 [compost metagenome]
MDLMPLAGFVTRTCEVSAIIVTGSKSRSGLYANDLYENGLSDMFDVLPNSRE